MAKSGLLAAAGSLIVAVKPWNQSCPAIVPLTSLLSLRYAPITVLGEEELVKAARPAAELLPMAIGALFQVTPSVVYCNCRFASPWVVAYQSKPTLIELNPAVLAANWAPCVPIGACDDQPLAAPLEP